MKTMLLMTLILAVWALPAAAQNPQLFDFNGQAVLPAAVGGTLSMHAEMFDPSPAIDSPIPLDFATYQYTLVVSDLLLVSEVVEFGITKQDYANGTITIYRDSGTSADFANPATFSDGTVVLVGTIGILQRTRPPFGNTGSVASQTVVWTGGDQFNDIADWQQNHSWILVAGTNDRATSVEPGYDEQWDGKVEPPEPIVPSTTTSWGALKALFD